MSAQEVVVKLGVMLAIIVILRILKELLVAGIDPLVIAAVIGTFGLAFTTLKDLVK